MGISDTMHPSASSWPRACRDPLGATGTFVAPGTLLWCATGLVDQPESSCAWVAAGWRGIVFNFQFNFQDEGVTVIFLQVSFLVCVCVIFCQVIFAGVQRL